MGDVCSRGVLETLPERRRAVLADVIKPLRYPVNPRQPPTQASEALLRKWRPTSELAEEFGKFQGRLVFTNGCFDILHAGHVRYLESAKRLGDRLFLALNSDRSVRELKGEGRPINNEWDRAEVVAALESVDFVAIFDEPRVTALVQQLAPEVYAKGGDYTVETLNPEERAALQACGAEFRFLPLVPGRSTSRIIDNIQSTPP